MSAIGPGDRVRCIRTRSRLDTVSPAHAARVGGARIDAGCEYTVAHVRDEDHLSSGAVEYMPNLILGEPSTHWTAWNGDDGGWRVQHFRKIDRPWIAALLTITTDSKADQPETVT